MFYYTTKANRILKIKNNIIFLILQRYSHKKNTLRTKQMSSYSAFLPPFPKKRVNAFLRFILFKSSTSERNISVFKSLTVRAQIKFLSRNGREGKQNSQEGHLIKFISVCTQPVLLKNLLCQKKVTSFATHNPFIASVV